MGQSLKSFINFLSEKILKGKVMQFAYKNLEGRFHYICLSLHHTYHHPPGHYTEKDLKNITLAILQPSFVCQSREAVWWNADDQKIGWLDNFASILSFSSSPLLSPPP